MVGMRRVVSAPADLAKMTHREKPTKSKAPTFFIRLFGKDDENIELDGENSKENGQRTTDIIRNDIFSEVSTIVTDQIPGGDNETDDTREYLSQVAFQYAVTKFFAPTKWQECEASTIAAEFMKRVILSVLIHRLLHFIYAAAHMEHLPHLPHLIESLGS